MVRAKQAEARRVEQLALQEERRTRNACEAVLNGIMDKVVDVEEKRLKKEQQRAKDHLLRMQHRCPVGFSAGKTLEQAYWGQSQLDRFQMFKGHVDRATALEHAEIRKDDNEHESASPQQVRRSSRQSGASLIPPPLQATLPVVAASISPTSGEKENISLDDLRLCFPDLFDTFSRLGGPRIAQVSSQHSKLE